MGGRAACSGALCQHRALTIDRFTVRLVLPAQRAGLHAPLAQRSLPAPEGGFACLTRVCNALGLQKFGPRRTSKSACAAAAAAAAAATKPVVVSLLCSSNAAATSIT